MADYEPENLRRLPFESAGVREDARTLPLGSNEGSRGAIPASGKSEADAYAERMSALPGTWRGAAYGFFSGLAGQDPMAAVRGAIETQQGERRLGLQGRQVAVEEGGLTLREKALTETVKQHMQTTQIAVGDLAYKYVKEIASVPASQRRPVADMAKRFLGPLMESLGMPIPDTAFDAMMSAPEAADAYAGVIGGWFSKEPEKIKALNAAIGNMPKDDPKKVVDFLKSVFDQETVIAGPKVMQVAEQYMNHIWKQGAATQQRLGLIDSTGKRLPLNLSLNNFADAFKAITGNDPTPAEHGAMRDLMLDTKNAGFWVKIGVTPGKHAEEQASVVGKAAAELTTQQGRGKQALQAAQTAEAIAREKEIMGGKTTPLQAGAGFVHTKPGEAPVVMKAPEAKLADVQAMRGQFEKQAKEFITTRDFYQSLSSAEDTPAGDLTRIFSYMKILDPTSVVMQGEQATAKNARGVPDDIRARYNALLGGGSLAPNQRKEFAAQAKKIMDTRIGSHGNLEQQYRKIAERAGINPDDVVVDFMGGLRNTGGKFSSADERARAKFLPRK